MKSISEGLKNIDQLLKSGQIAKAKEIIKEASASIKKRQDKLELAKLARRAGLPSVALKTLHSHVRVSEDASPQELSEYAISLIRMGFYREGRELLSLKSMQNLPETFFYSAFADIYCWDYLSASQNLMKYLKYDLSEYEKIVAEVNLASCQVITRMTGHQPAQYLSDIILRAQHLNAHRLEANALELLTQHYLYNNKDSLARKTLKKASGLLHETASFDGFIINKWNLLAEIKNNKGDKNLILKAVAMREQAQTLQYWEIARDIDFHLGIWNRNRSILTHLYFGTPFESYKKRILQQSEVELPISYEWRLNQKMRPKSVLNLDTGRMSADSDFQLLGNEEVSDQVLKLLRALSLDFYRPTRISSIVDILYKGEYFDPFTTPNRVYQVVWRFKKELLNLKIPLQVIDNEGYLLTSTSSFGLSVVENYEPQRTDLERLQNQFKNTYFSSQQAVDFLNKSKRSIQLVLTEAVRDNTLIREGKSRSIRYKFSQ